LVQTIEGNPAIIHGGPFANIAQGTNSVIATRLGMTFSDYVVTEAGFGFDLGGEKFLDIKCQSAGLKPKAIVLTTTIRALKYHGGADLNSLTTPNVDALKNGLPNLQKHLENVLKFNITPVIAVNKFLTDSDEEIDVIRQFAKSENIKFAVAEVWAKGGKGALDLAQCVIDAVEEGKSNFKPLYTWDLPVTEKIETIAKEIYGASHVEYSALAKNHLKRIADLGLDKLPICMAKTQKSLSDNPDLLGRPKDFTITIREIEICVGAGFLVPITGTMMRMPGLPSHPSSEGIDVNDDGEIVGLF
jgi:formate--tetrahydrofolate ligase